jgi:hypothetical protein
MDYLNNTVISFLLKEIKFTVAWLSIMPRHRSLTGLLHPVRLDLSAESAAIQQCFSLTTNQRTVLSAQ